MRLLDLFCGAGGAAMGYHRAGFDEIVGVDIRPMKHYPFQFVQGDALEYVIAHGWEFDAIHASPPCQAYTVARNIHKRDHPRLIPAVRATLRLIGKPYVIENVRGATLSHPKCVCGTAFGLTVVVRGIRYELRRHRFFESSEHLWATQCRHSLPVIGVYGHGESKPMREKRGYQISQVTARREVMQMPWANRDEIAEAVPPAYTEFIGHQLLEHLGSAGRAGVRVLAG